MAVKNEPLYNDEGLSKDILLNLSGATLEDILAKIDEIYQSWEEAEDDADPEKFCEGCEEIVIISEREQYFGATCYREFPSCKAEFDPDCDDCPRSDEYRERLENRNRLRKSLDTLHQAEEVYGTKEQKGA